MHIDFLKLKYEFTCVLYLYKKISSAFYDIEYILNIKLKK